MDKYRGKLCEVFDTDKKEWIECQFVSLSLSTVLMEPIVQIKGRMPWFATWGTFRGIPQKELLEYYTSRPIAPRPDLDGSLHHTNPKSYTEAAYRCAANSVVVVTNSMRPADWRIPDEDRMIPIPEGHPVVPYFFEGSEKELAYLREKIVDTWVRLLLDDTIADGTPLAGLRRGSIPDIGRSMVDRFAFQEVCDYVHEANLNPIRWCRTTDGVVGALWGSFVWLDGQCVVPRERDRPETLASRSMLVFYGFLKD